MLRLILQWILEISLLKNHNNLRLGVLGNLLKYALHTKNNLVYIQIYILLQGYLFIKIQLVNKIELINIIQFLLEQDRRILIGRMEYTTI